MSNNFIQIDCAHCKNKIIINQMKLIRNNSRYMYSSARWTNFILCNVCKTKNTLILSLG